jgi:dienelactone hydrolase
MGKVRGRAAVRWGWAVAMSAVALCSVAQAEPYGAFGPEGPRMREQLWIVPGGDPSVPLRATLFRPDWGTGTPQRRPLVVINHGSDAGTREALAAPVFYWLSRWFVDRGYVVLLPQRRGFGSTGGDFVEGRDLCSDADHYSAGAAAADDIEGALKYMQVQPFVESTQTVVVGVSTGGWASLALAARNPPGVRLIVNFAGGRGGHAFGVAKAICQPERLIAAVSEFGSRARVPTLWFYAKNDSYFEPKLATSLAGAWQSKGGEADLRLVPEYGADGHNLVDDRAGWRVWGADLDRVLQSLNGVNGVRAVMSSTITR